ncbi:MAG: NUDIX domain-containing protein [Pseudomonadales bacterium]|jgi:8-oxo-dGTP diphosphatase|nr:NUDIX domain-containing protein [Pseudomonadales bacterium]MDP7357556.1 NUDIX domain-containing protein [Pseudomonadales bacterium]MDP7597845.1 NUDIX domain-containing protein [Pseudomonadales bacterium]HJN51081.1 NUDIX domain-containing protein [Pseudomonadales bacterium]|tara:strand:+ start:1309 stop:1998 length:690 start_codon:yes stop_codon:yes gene_type:complete
MPFTYAHARPALSTDCVVFGLDAEDLKILLIKRALEPFKGRWGLPGGLARVGESLEDTARRELAEETGLRQVFLEQLYTFSSPDRNPQEHVITAAYYALVNLSEHPVRASTDARGVAWFGLTEVPRLAFDHAKILELACERLRGKIRYQPIGFELLPRKFPVRELQRLYEKILGRALDKRNFRKKILNMGILQELAQTETDVAHRAARLYRFSKEKYDRMKKQGFNFEV